MSLEEISEPKVQKPTTPPRPKKPMTARQAKIMALAAKSQPKLGSGYIKMNPGMTKLQAWFEVFLIGIFQNQKVRLKNSKPD